MIFLQFYVYKNVAAVSDVTPWTYSDFTACKAVHILWLNRKYAGLPIITRVEIIRHNKKFKRTEANLFNIQLNQGINYKEI